MSNNYVNYNNLLYILPLNVNILFFIVQIPKILKSVSFSKPYKAPPPAPDSERTPEVIEAEIKALETAMEALALVTLKYIFLFEIIMNMI